MSPIFNTLVRYRNPSPILPADPLPSGLCDHCSRHHAVGVVSNEVWVEHFVYHALAPLTEGSSSRRCTLALFSEPTHGPRHKDRCR
jgi:hypothetical protein